MAVIPASMSSIARIAHGVSDDLLTRAADVMLKERRRLVLVPRESPYSAIHLENMLALTRVGAVIVPASPSFYGRPSTLEDVLDSVLSRVLDHLGLPNALSRRWGQDVSLEPALENERE
jgi:4-hydroxy-3-polyprenylbenzoate decarboxylase